MFAIKRCLLSFREFLKSISCCNSKCMNNTINALDDDTIERLQNLQNQLENVIKEVNTLRRQSSSSRQITYV